MIEWLKVGVSVLYDRPMWRRLLGCVPLVVEDKLREKEECELTVPKAAQDLWVR